MDLSRGICILCTSSTKIVIPSQAEHITSLIIDILSDQIDTTKFSEITNTLKVCPLCLHDLLTLSKIKNNLNDTFCEHQEKCSLCWKQEHLVVVKNWNYFNTILENVTLTKKMTTECCVCLDCLKYLDLLQKVKMNFLKKYPHLCVSDSLKNKKKMQHRKETKVVPERSYRQALKHLKPLKNSSFNVEEFKSDDRFYKQVPFVKLEKSSVIHSLNADLLNKYPKKHLSEDSNKTNTIKHSFFKIKLKASKKTTSGKLMKSNMKSYKIVPGDHQKELFVKLSKMNFEHYTATYKYNRLNDNYSKPTKASRKMLPDDEAILANEMHKRVSFSDIVSVEVKEGKQHNVNGSPLKSLLKKSKTTCNDSNSSNIKSESDSDNIPVLDKSIDSCASDVNIPSGSATPSNECDTNEVVVDDDEHKSDVEVDPISNLNEKLMNAIVDNCGTEGLEHKIATLSSSPDSSNNDNELSNINSTEDVILNGVVEEVLQNLTEREEISTDEDDLVSSTSTDKTIIHKNSVTNEENSENNVNVITSPFHSPDTSNSQLTSDAVNNVSDSNASDSCENLDLVLKETDSEDGSVETEKISRKRLNVEDDKVHETKKAKLNLNSSDTEDDILEGVLTEVVSNFNDNKHETDSNESPDKLKEQDKDNCKSSNQNDSISDDIMDNVTVPVDDKNADVEKNVITNSLENDILDAALSQILESNAEALNINSALEQSNSEQYKCEIDNSEITNTIEENKTEKLEGNEKEEPASVMERSGNTIDIDMVLNNEILSNEEEHKEVLSRVTDSGCNDILQQNDKDDGSKSTGALESNCANVENFDNKADSDSDKVYEETVPGGE